MSLFVMDIVKQQVEAIMVVFILQLMFIYTDNPIRQLKWQSTVFVNINFGIPYFIRFFPSQMFSLERTSVNFSMQGCISIVNKINLLSS